MIAKGKKKRLNNMIRVRTGKRDFATLQNVYDFDTHTHTKRKTNNKNHNLARSWTYAEPNSSLHGHRTAHNARLRLPTLQRIP